MERIEVLHRILAKKEITDIPHQIVHAYIRSYEHELPFLDFNDLNGDFKDIKKIVECLKHLGIKKFTVSSTWTDTIKRLYHLCQAGCKIIKTDCLDEVKDWGIKKQTEKLYVVVFEIES